MCPAAFDKLTATIRPDNPHAVGPPRPLIDQRNSAVQVTVQRSTGRAMTWAPSDVG